MIHVGFGRLVFSKYAASTCATTAPPTEPMNIEKKWSGRADLNCARSVSERRYVALEPSFTVDVVQHRRSRSLFVSGVRTYVMTKFLRRVSAQPVPREFLVPLDDELVDVATSCCVRRSLWRSVAVSF